MQVLSTMISTTGFVVISLLTPLSVVKASPVELKSRALLQAPPDSMVYQDGDTLMLLSTTFKFARYHVDENLQITPIDHGTAAALKNLGALTAIRGGIMTAVDRNHVRLIDVTTPETPIVVDNLYLGACSAVDARFRDDGGIDVLCTSVDSRSDVFEVYLYRTLRDERGWSLGTVQAIADVSNRGTVQFVHDQIGRSDKYWIRYLQGSNYRLTDGQLRIQANVGFSVFDGAISALRYETGSILVIFDSEGRRQSEGRSAVSCKIEVAPHIFICAAVGEHTLFDVRTRPERLVLLGLPRDNERKSLVTTLSGGRGAFLTTTHGYVEIYQINASYQDAVVNP